MRFRYMRTNFDVKAFSNDFSLHVIFHIPESFYYSGYL